MKHLSLNVSYPIQYHAGSTEKVEQPCSQAPLNPH